MRVCARAATDQFPLYGHQPTGSRSLCPPSHIAPQASPVCNVNNSGGGGGGGRARAHEDRAGDKAQCIADRGRRRSLFFCQRNREGVQSRARANARVL